MDFPDRIYRDVNVRLNFVAILNFELITLRRSAAIAPE